MHDVLSLGYCEHSAYYADGIYFFLNFAQYMIDRNTIQRIMDAADIVDVVKEFVTLRKAGVNYKGLCPFHDEKTPSFVVSPSKQLCKCFSCGKGGNAVHFVMEHEQMSYPEALKWLGKKYGIEVEEKELTEEEKQIASERESMFVLNEWARNYFSELLHNHVDGVAIGMAYFRQRGFRDDIIRKFDLGFCLPEKESLAKAAQAKGFNPEYLVKTGLCYRTDDGRLFDRYHGRVIFPVHTVSGKIVAFGGRILTSDKKVAKYVNSPESDIYSKSHELYGLYLAKHAIVKQNRCFLVEGYTDVISMHQSGIENVVASSGTSLTEGQIRLLHRFTNNITVLYDGDSAGIKASLRGIDMLLSEGLNIKVLLLPDGDDPDSFARKHSAVEFQEYIDAHQVDFIKFKIDLLLEDAHGDPIKLAELLQDVVNSIAVIPQGVVRQMYVRECARLMSVDEQLVISEIGKVRRELRGGPMKPVQKSGGDVPEAASQKAISVSVIKTKKEEELLVRVLIRYGERYFASVSDDSGEEVSMTVAQYIAADFNGDNVQFSMPLYQQILAEACEKCTDGEHTALQYFMTHPNAEISGLAARLGAERYMLSQSQLQGFVPDEERLANLIPRLIHDFKYSLVRDELQQLQSQLSRPEAMSDLDLCRDVMRRYKELSEIERQFASVLGDRVLTIV